MRLALALAILAGSCSTLIPCVAAEASVAAAPAMPCHAPMPKTPEPDCAVMPCCHGAFLQASVAVPALRLKLVAVLTAALDLPSSVHAESSAGSEAPPGALPQLRAAHLLGRAPPLA